MAEFRNPGREGREVTRSFVILLIVMACMSFGWRRPSTASAAGSGSLHAQQVRVEVSKIASPGASVSMNVVERELFVALAFIHGRVVTHLSGSWGWSIVLLTVGINLLMLPLRIASMQSGVKMQRIQPGIDAIKTRYKNIKLPDPCHNEMSTEIAKLQKDAGINPFGGCVPLLIQMPLLIAFFGMLRKATALHGAEWFWLHDLSSADPYHVLPILMVIFQMLVQFYTPSPGTDARQQKIISFLMALGFGYVSWHYASGLALYALTGSLLSIGIQAAMNLTPLGREMRALRTSHGG
jgi:YidC/Oxa1 family membrane protein insertase